MLGTIRLAPSVVSRTTPVHLSATVASPLLSLLPHSSSTMRAAILVLVSMAAVVSAGPTMKMYEKTNDKIYKRVLVPVASTVIPLEELPVYTVGAGVGVGSSITIDEKLRPEGPVKLVTIHSIHRNKNKKDKTEKDVSSAAHIEELTEEEYKILTQQDQQE